MASAWGTSWGTSWASSWGTTVEVVRDTSTILMPGKAGPSGIAFTRKRFDELMAAWRAQEALEAKAKESTGKRRKAMQAAAEASANVLRAVEELREEAEAATKTRELVELTNALDAARAAKGMTETIKLARAAENYAQQMMDDEEEALFILLQ